MIAKHDSMGGKESLKDDLPDATYDVCVMAAMRAREDTKIADALDGLANDASGQNDLFHRPPLASLRPEAGST